MSLANSIVEYLTRNPLQKGREVAAALGLAKHEVNSTLYRLEGSYFRHDEEFRWEAITQTAPKEAAIPAGASEINGARLNALRARREINRLKRGVPPTWSVEELAVGMDNLMSRLDGLLQSGASPRWFGVAGEYGEGKSFFRSLASETALGSGYAVATLDVNKDEGALNHPQRHYSGIVASLRSPMQALDDSFGLSELFQTWFESASRKEIAHAIKGLQAVEPILPPGLSQGNLNWMASHLHELLSNAQTELSSNGPISQWCRSSLIPFLSGDDLVKKGPYARFSAAYRFQLLLRWLEVTGHKGLLLFIDEIDNVIRQIPGKGHPACFRTLAWYCSSSAFRSLRVVFASTPEVVDVIDHEGRASFSRTLSYQQTVRREEFKTYEDWRREADALGSEMWSQCPRLTRSERLALFERIARIHDVAWGANKERNPSIIDSLSRLPQFTTTRRWVRATAQLLDLFEQHRNHKSVDVS